MASRPTTRAKNKTQHPGSSHTRYDVKRRSASQIARDNVIQAEARLEAIHAMAGKRQREIQETAEYEAQFQERVEHRRKHAARPDLESPPEVRPKLTITIKNPSTTSANSLSPRGLHPDTEGSNEVPEEGYEHEDSEYDFPPMSVTGADSDSAPPTLDLGERPESTSDVEGDYHPGSEYESNSEGDDEQDESMKAAIHKKNKRGQLRESIHSKINQLKNKPRGISAPHTDLLPEVGGHARKGRDNGSNKRKASEDHRDRFAEGTEASESRLGGGTRQQHGNKFIEQTAKRSKVGGALGGLRAGWKGLKLGNLRSKKPESGDMSNMLNVEPCEPSSFAPIHDSPENPAPIPLDPELEPAPQVSVDARTTRQMGITVEHAGVAESIPRGFTATKSSHRVEPKSTYNGPSIVSAQAIAQRSSRGTKATPYTKYDLPFPRDSVTRMVSTWSKKYMAGIYDWVATLDNPWQANSHPDFSTKVKDIWLSTFPDLRLQVNHPAIEFLAGSGIRSWRSKIGSNTLTVVDGLFKDKTPEDIQQEISAYLPAPRFLWREPDAPDGQREGWLSDVFLKAFAYHIQYMLKAKSEPAGYPVGAAAITAAAIERSFNLWKSGTRDSVQGEFNQQDWGAITRHYALSTSQLTDAKWDSIIKGTIALMPATKANAWASQEDLQSELFPADDRACVVD